MHTWVHKYGIDAQGDEPNGDSWPGYHGQKNVCNVTSLMVHFAEKNVIESNYMW